MEVIEEKLESLQQQVATLLARDTMFVPADKNRSFPNPALIPSSYSMPTLQSPKPASRSHIGQSPQSSQKLYNMDTSTALRGRANETGKPTRSRSGISTTAAASGPSNKIAVTCHPLLAISSSEAMQLIDTYDDECGSAYPLIDIGHLRSFVSEFYDAINRSRRPATWRPFHVDQLSKESLHILEIVLAIALVIEGSGSSDLGAALVDELEAEIDHRPSGTTVDMPFAKILTLMVSFASLHLS